MKTFLNRNSNMILESIGFDALEKRLNDHGAAVSIRHNAAGDLVGFRVLTNGMKVHSEKTLPVYRLADCAQRMSNTADLIRKLKKAA